MTSDRDDRNQPQPPRTIKLSDVANNPDYFQDQDTKDLLMSVGADEKLADALIKVKRSLQHLSEEEQASRMAALMTGEITNAAELYREIEQPAPLKLWTAEEKKRRFKPESDKPDLPDH